MYYLITGTYYLITGTYEDEDGSGNFEWVVEAENQAAAIDQLEKGETMVSIREISVEERIEREERELMGSVKREYLSQFIDDLPIREANKQAKELNANPEIYYLALKYFNKRWRLTRMLKRRKGFGELSMKEYKEVLNKLIDAQTEEEFNNVVNSLDR